MQKVQTQFREANAIECTASKVPRVWSRRVTKEGQCGLICHSIVDGNVEIDIELEVKIEVEVRFR